MASINPRKEAAYYTREEDSYSCGLCPHHCRIPVDGYGRCGSRRGDADILVAYSYGKVSSICVDPIEKKPLYNFRPRSRIFSVGGIGCNMFCKHCQNYAISMSPSGKKRTTYESPEELVGLCRSERMDAIAFTYNEPMIWYEYIMDVAECDPDLTCVLVTNGLAEEGPLRDLCKVSSAMNIDVKGFTDGFYMKVCGAHLEDVLSSAKTVHEEKVHLELTYLVIPGYNDSEDELTRFSEWVRDELSGEVPVHFTRFHPDNELTDIQWTPVETLMRAQDLAFGAGLSYVYVGNVLNQGAADTYCPECGNVVIKRLGYMVDIVGLDGTRCSNCRKALNIII